MKKTITDLFFAFPGSRDFILRMIDQRSGGSEKNTESETPDQQAQDPEKQENEIPDKEPAGENQGKDTTVETEQEDPFIGRMRDSIQLMTGFAAGRGISGEKLDRILLDLFRTAVDVADGKISVRMAEMMIRAISYEADVAKARLQGEIAGRNARIEERMRTADDSDGVPRLTDTSTSSAVSAPASIFDLVRSAR